MPDIAGLKLIVPTSVAGSGVSVSATGKVTFTAAATVSVNGCFSASYDNYLVVVQQVRSSGTSDYYMRLRASGTDNSTSNSYVSQGLYADGASVTASRLTNNLAYISATGSAQRDGYHMYFYGPFLAQPTAYRSVTVWSGSNASLSDYAVTHNQSTAYDGFTLYPASGTISGALCVYGLAQ